MTAVMLVQVFLRYGLNNSLPWSEELSKTLMVWGAFAVAPWAFRSRNLVAINMLLSALPKKLILLVFILQSMLILWICSNFVLEGVDFVGRGANVMAASLPVSVSWFYAIVPASFFALALISIEHLISEILALMKNEEDEFTTYLFPETDDAT